MEKGNSINSNREGLYKYLNQNKEEKKALGIHIGKELY